jgi:hypothetical protein
MNPTTPTKQEGKTMAIFKLSGCGVSAIGPWDATMQWIFERMVERGGIPEVQVL